MRKYLPYFLIFVFITVLLLISFLNSDPVRLNQVTVPGKFNIAIPEYLVRADSLDASTLLQYQNQQEQVFLLIYEENDSMRSLEEYFKKFSGDFISGLAHGNLITYYPEKINGTDALIGNVTGRVNGMEVYYRIAAFDGDHTFYKLIAGTTGRNRSSYAEDFDGITRSLDFQPGK